MSNVLYKFRADKDYQSVTFDGTAITLKELKTKIAEKKKIGKETDSDLKIENAQTGI
eukprot:Awhi_evm1s10661